jgi:hypothetical protein
MNWTHHTHGGWTVGYSGLFKRVEDETKSIAFWMAYRPDAPKKDAWFSATNGGVWHESGGDYSHSADEFALEGWPSFIEDGDETPWSDRALGRLHGILDAIA